MIYKFFSGSDEANPVVRLRQTLDDNTLWAADPRTFNDPFECKVTLDLTASESERRARFKADNPSASEEDFQSWNSTLDTSKWFIEQNTRSEIMHKHGIACFTHDWNNALLWAHYGKDHTGFCIGFDKDVLSQWGEVAAWGDIDYRDDVHPFRFFHDSKLEFVRRTAFTKSLSWAYEKEYRLLFSSVGLKNLPAGAITEVTLGCRASTELKQELRIRLSQGQSGHIAFYQAFELPTRYRLERELIQENRYTMTSNF